MKWLSRMFSTLTQPKPVEKKGDSMELFLSLIPAILSAAPTVVGGVEYLHKEADSATKQQLALDSLSLLLVGAKPFLPVGSEGLESGFGSVIASIINLTVSGFNASGIFHHKAATA